MRQLDLSAILTKKEKKNEKQPNFWTKSLPHPPHLSFSELYSIW